MIVNHKGYKWRVTKLACGYQWRAYKLKENGDPVDNNISVTLNKEQWDKWKEQ